ncbi:hypothetical protein ON010_g18740 [Phytophthora cinnamomi]|nr:hypothetical protein ON010_g18740 [Phytophthora cinnamomi]
MQTLPSAWRPMVASWRGVRPFVPYAELVEKVIATRERLQTQAEAASAPNSAVLTRQTSNAGSSPLDGQVGQLPEKTVGKSAAVNPVTQSKTKPVETAVEEPANKPAEGLASKPASKHEDKPAEKRAAEAPSTEKVSKTSKPVPPPIDTADNTVDLTSGEVSTTSSTGENKALSSTRSHSTTKKSSVEQSDKAKTRSSKDDSKREKNDTYEKRSRYDKQDMERGYDNCASYSRYDRSPRKSYNKYDKSGSPHEALLVPEGGHRERHDPRHTQEVLVRRDNRSEPVHGPLPGGIHRRGEPNSRRDDSAAQPRRLRSGGECGASLQPPEPDLRAATAARRAPFVRVPRPAAVLLGVVSQLPQALAQRVPAGRGAPVVSRPAAQPVAQHVSRRGGRR